MRIHSFVLVFVSFSVLSACSGTPNANETSNNAVSTASYHSIGSVKVPDGILSDIPLPKDGVIDSSMAALSARDAIAQGMQGGQVMYISTSLSLDDAVAFYTSYFEKAGWKSHSVLRMGKTEMVAFEKDALLVTANVSSPSADAPTVVMLSASEKPY